ncbi:MAG: ATP-binding region ATPase domain protein [Frankiales bacterium]|jgi:hypothetical protein|nr:ATP-binding region ATPase domain protein [Frankiales bacterium]
MLAAEVRLPGMTSSVPTARHFVESLLRAWGHPDLGWTAAVCVSELASNCALHARTAFEIRVALTETTVRLEVSDGSLRLPVTRDYGAEATTGRGLRMLDEIAQRWGVEVHEAPAGKTVWVELGSAPPSGGGRLDEELSELAQAALLAAFPDEAEVYPGRSPQARAA